MENWMRVVDGPRVVERVEVQWAEDEKEADAKAESKMWNNFWAMKESVFKNGHRKAMDPREDPSTRAAGPFPREELEATEALMHEMLNQ